MTKWQPPVGLRQQRRHTPKADLSRLYQRALMEALRKLDPCMAVKNPVMFVVWVGTGITALLTLNPNLFGVTDTTAGFNALVTVILLFTVLFANYAEAVAEGRGKAQADALRTIQTQTHVKRLLPDGSIERVGQFYGTSHGRPDSS